MKAETPAGPRLGVSAATLPCIDVATAIKIRRFRPLRLLQLVLAVAFLVFIANAFANGQIDWPVAGQYLFSPIILTGLGFTVLMTVVAMAIGLVVAVMAAVGFGSHNFVVRWIAKSYIWLFRGTPLLLQLLLWFNMALVFPRIGLPGIGYESTVDLMTPFIGAAIGLGLNAGAYMSEIIRAGLLSVDAGQYEAAKAIGMTRGKALRKVIFPQAMRVIIPPIGNEFIGMSKNTSLASVIGFTELLFEAQSVYFSNFKVIELLIVAAVWYLVVTTLLSIGQHYLEQRFGRGFRTGRHQ
jgi:polar amino acid transport system permease protein